jgi:WD40-like Beta Propeller Repeat
VIDRVARAACRSWLGLVAVVALAAPVAHAGIVAAVNVPVPNGAACPQQTDIALIDPATGAKSSLPPGVNTPADELHPSITPDGRRMAFETFDPTGGTTRIRVVDLTTGDQADLFNAFEVGVTQPTTPAIASDGSSVITGVPLVPSGSQFSAFWNVTSLANFPGGPFAHSQRAANSSFAVSGQTTRPDVRSDGDIVSDVQLNQTNPSDELLVSFPNGLSSVADAGSHPALSDPTTNVVVFETSNTFPQYTDLAFRPVSGFPSAPSVTLPALVSGSGSDELQPAFTPDGRYLGFIRNAHSGDHHDRLFVFDTATQTLLNPSGIDLGYFSFSCSPERAFSLYGGISLRETFTLTLTSFNFSTGLFSFQVQSSTGVGILVQRIVGHHRLLGRVVPTLKVVGRVPFGLFKRGRHHVHWNLRVNGHRLRRGTYLVTPRLVTRKLLVTELGKPRVLRIR